MKLGQFAVSVLVAYLATVPALGQDNMELTYRTAGLGIRENSVFHSEDDTDYLDQIYGIITLSRVHKFSHRVVFEPSFRTPRENPDSSRLEVQLEQAYLASKFGPLVLTAGKKTEYDGAGFLVNPSDLLNEEKDQFDPLYQREGRVFTRLTYLIGDFSLGVGFIPKRAHHFRSGKAWLQASAELFSVDSKLQYTAQRQEKSTVGWSLSRFFGRTIELHWDGRRQSRRRGMEQQPELAFSGLDTDEPSVYHVAGSRVVFTPKRTLVLEAMQNTGGLLPEEMELYFKSLEGLNERPESRLLARRYVFATYQDEDTFEDWLFSVSGTLNTDDQSIFASAQARHHFSPLTSIEVAPTVYRGERYSEFGEMPFHTVAYLILKGRF